MGGDDKEKRKKIRRKKSRSRSKSEKRGRNPSHKRSSRGHKRKDKSQDRDKVKNNKSSDRDRSRKSFKSQDDINEAPSAAKEVSNTVQVAKKKLENELQTKTGGAYLPPAKLRLMQKEIQDKSSAAYQRLAWEALKKSINGLINKVNISNIAIIVRELFKENLIRGRGLLCRSVMQAQSVSGTLSNVYAAIVAIINAKFPNIGELLLRRLIIQFRRSYKRNDKNNCLASVKFIGHLINQQVAHELLGLEILMLLLEHPTEDSVEVGIAFLKEVGQRLDDISPKGALTIFERLRVILHEGKLDKRVQYMIEVMFQVRKDKYKDFVSVPEELDLVEEADQFTHLITLDNVTEGQDILNVFKMDDEYLENEDKYASLKKEILDEDPDEEGGEEEGDEESDQEGEAEEGQTEEDKNKILDKTETNLLALRRTIYLTIQSSLDFEECAHKLLRLQLKEGQEVELCHMILDCCAQQRTYEKFFGLLSQRFCNLNQAYVLAYETIFKDAYDTVHRLDTNKLRNVAKFFAHLLFTDSIPWTVMQNIKMGLEDTTSSSRIFVKILFQELSEYMGLPKLNARLEDQTLVQYFEGLFPRDHPKNTRFSINFFTSIGLGGLTDALREHLKKIPKPIAIVNPNPVVSTSLVQSESKLSSSSSDTSAESSASDNDSPPPKRKKKGKKDSSKKMSISKDKKKSKKKQQKIDKQKQAPNVREWDVGKVAEDIDDTDRLVWGRDRSQQNQEDNYRGGGRDRDENYQSSTRRYDEEIDRSLERNEYFQEKESQIDTNLDRRGKADRSRKRDDDRGEVDIRNKRSRASEYFDKNEDNERPRSRERRDRNDGKPKDLDSSRDLKRIRSIRDREIDRSRKESVEKCQNRYYIYRKCEISERNRYEKELDKSRSRDTIRTDKKGRRMSSASEELDKRQKDSDKYRNRYRDEYSSEKDTENKRFKRRERNPSQDYERERNKSSGSERNKARYGL